MILSPGIGSGFGNASKFNSPSTFGSSSGAGGSNFNNPAGRGVGGTFGTNQQASGGGFKTGAVGTGGYQSSFQQPAGAGGYQPSMASGWKKGAPLPAVGANKKPTGSSNYGPGPRRTDWTSK